MKPPRDDQAPVPDSGRDPTVVLRSSQVGPWKPPGAIEPTKPTAPAAAPPPAKPPKVSMEVVSVAGLVQAVRELSVAGLAQATRELAVQVRRSRQVTSRLTSAIHFLAGVVIGVAIAALALVLWLSRAG